VPLGGVRLDQKGYGGGGGAGEEDGDDDDDGETEFTVPPLDFGRGTRSLAEGLGPAAAAAAAATPVDHASSGASGDAGAAAPSAAASAGSEHNEGAGEFLTHSARKGAQIKSREVHVCAGTNHMHPSRVCSFGRVCGTQLPAGSCGRPAVSRPPLILRCCGHLCARARSPSLCPVSPEAETQLLTVSEIEQKISGDPMVRQRP